MASMDGILGPCGISTHVWDLITFPERKRWSDVEEIVEVVNGDGTTVEHALLFCHSLASELVGRPANVSTRWFDVLYGIIVKLAIHALDVPEEGRGAYERTIATAMCIHEPTPTPYTMDEAVGMYNRSPVTRNRWVKNSCFTFINILYLLCGRRIGMKRRGVHRSGGGWVGVYVNGFHVYVYIRDTVCVCMYIRCMCTCTCVLGACV